MGGLRCWLHFWRRALVNATASGKSALNRLLYGVSLIALFGVTIVVSPRVLAARSMPERILVVVVVCLLLLCQGAYLTWREDQSEREARRQANTEERGDVRAALSQYLHQGEELMKDIYLVARTERQISHEQLQTRVSRWNEGIQRVLEELGPDYYAQFCSSAGLVERERPLQVLQTLGVST